MLKGQQSLLLLVLLSPLVLADAHFDAGGLHEHIIRRIVARAGPTRFEKARRRRASGLEGRQVVSADTGVTGTSSVNQGGFTMGNFPMYLAVAIAAGVMVVVIILFFTIRYIKQRRQLSSTRPKDTPANPSRDSRQSFDSSKTLTELPTPKFTPITMSEKTTGIRRFTPLYTAATTPSSPALPSTTHPSNSDLGNKHSVLVPVGELLNITPDWQYGNSRTGPIVTSTTDKSSLQNKKKVIVEQPPPLTSFIRLQRASVSSTSSSTLTGRTSPTNHHQPQIPAPPYSLFSNPFSPSPPPPTVDPSIAPKADWKPPTTPSPEGRDLDDDGDESGSDYEDADEHIISSRTNTPQTSSAKKGRKGKESESEEEEERAPSPVRVRPVSAAGSTRSITIVARAGSVGSTHEVHESHLPWPAGARKPSLEQ